MGGTACTDCNMLLTARHAGPGARHLGGGSSKPWSSSKPGTMHDGPLCPSQSLGPTIIYKSEVPIPPVITSHLQFMAYPCQPMPSIANKSYGRRDPRIEASRQDKRKPITRSCETDDRRLIVAIEVIDRILLTRPTKQQLPDVPNLRSLLSFHVAMLAIFQRSSPICNY